MVLIALGVLGLIGGPIIGRPSGTPILVTGPGHDILHLVLGALYAHVCLALSGRMAADGLSVLGALNIAIVVATFLSADVLGLLGAPANLGDQTLHLVLGVTTLVAGRLARTGRSVSLGRGGGATGDR